MAMHAEVSVPWQESGVWPESPQARAIRQAEMPAPAMLTGACEFDVPLYTLSVGDVSLPLSLHYRSNGIRVDDDPQPVGYGWTLSPALRVSRQIMGRPDELFRPRGTDNIEDYETNFRSVVMDATGYNRGRRCTAYNYDGTIASRTYSYKKSYLPDMEEVYAYDSCGRLTSTTIRVDKAVSVPVLNPAAGQDAADSEATDTASPAASSRWATAVVRREYDAIGRLARLSNITAITEALPFDGVTGLHGAIAPTA